MGNKTGAVHSSACKWSWKIDETVKLRKQTMKIFHLSQVRLAAAAMLLLCSTAHANILITFKDNGTLTTATITGSIDLGALGTPTAANQVQPTRYLHPANGWFGNATSNVNRYNSTSFSTLSGYGGGPFATTTGAGATISGDTFAFYRSLGRLEIGSGYVSNSQLNGSMILVGTIASLGINPFTQYSFSRSAVLGGTGVSQTITLQTVTAIPEPGTWAMMSAGLFAIAGIARRARRP